MRKVHISWQIAGASIGFLVGIGLSLCEFVSFASALAWGIFSFGLLILSLTKRTLRFALLTMCAGLAVGLWRGAGEQAALSRYQPYYNRQVTVQGRVNEDPTTGGQGDTRVQLVHVVLNGQPMHGKIWASTATKLAVERSDTLTLHGKLGGGFGNIPASMSDAQLVALAPTNQGDTALHVRDWFASGIRRAIPEPQSSLGSGFLVGQHASLPGTLNDELKVVGLTHAVVASGSNLTLLVGLTRRLFMRVSKYTATLAGGLMTAGFIMITGLSPSMTRAGLVTGLSLAAWYYGRRIHPLVLIPLAAAITAAATPEYIWGDIGWYLSFGSFVGVLIIAPLLQHYFWGEHYKPNVIMEILIGTTAAQIATMPVTLYSFGTYSTYALLANILVLPLVPLAMLLTFVAGIAGLVWAGAAHIVGLPATLVMKYMTFVIDWVARLPGAQGQISYTHVALSLSYLALAAAALYMWRKTAHIFREDTNITIGERV